MSFFLDDNTALTLPAIPERDCTGRGEGRRSEVNAQLPLSSSEPGVSGAGDQPELVPSSSRQGQSQADCPNPTPSPLPKFSTDLPSRPPITCLQDPFPSWRAVWSHVESNSSFSLLMIVKNTVHNTSACSSHLYVQPRLHIHG